jgi:hypothetical protein
LGMEQCCAMVKGRPCAVKADRYKKVPDKWYCHLHDPEGAHQLSKVKGPWKAPEPPARPRAHPTWAENKRAEKAKTAQIIARCSPFNRGLPL